MDIVDFVLQFFIFLIPGICSTLLYDSLNIRKERHYYIEILRLFFVSFISFAVVDLLICGITKLFHGLTWKPIDIVHQIGTKGLQIPIINVAVATGVAILFTGILVKARSGNWLFRFANKLHLTKRIDNQPVWEHAFDRNDIVVVRDKVTTNTYYGRVVAFSDNSEIRELILEDVYIYDQEGDRLYHTESVYLSRNHNEFTVETYNDQESYDSEKERGENDAKQ